MGQSNSTKSEITNAIAETIKVNMSMNKACSPSMLITQDNSITYDQPSHCPPAKSVNLSIDGSNNSINAEMLSKCVSKSKLSTSQLNNIQSKVASAIKNVTQSVSANVNVNKSKQVINTSTKLTESVRQSIEVKCQPAMSLYQDNQLSMRGCVLNLKLNTKNIKNKATAKGVSNCVLDDSQVSSQISKLANTVDQSSENTQKNSLSFLGGPLALLAMLGVAYFMFSTKGVETVKNVGESLLASWYFWSLTSLSMFCIAAACAYKANEYRESLKKTKDNNMTQQKYENELFAIAALFTAIGLLSVAKAFDVHADNMNREGR